MKQKLSQHQSGVTLIEFILTATVAMLGAVVVFSMYQDRRDNARIDRDLEYVEQVIGAIDNFFAADLSYGPINMEQFSQVGVIPPQIRYTNAGGDERLVTSFGEIRFDRDDTLIGSDDLMVVEMTGVPGEACPRVLRALMRRAYNIQIDGELIGMSPAPTVDRQGRHQLNWAQVTDLCQGERVDIAARRLKPLNVADLLPKSPRLPNPAEIQLYQREFARIRTAMASREAEQLVLANDGEIPAPTSICPQGVNTFYGCLGASGLLGL